MNSIVRTYHYVLQKISEHPFSRTSVNGCIWIKFKIFWKFFQLKPTLTATFFDWEMTFSKLITVKMKIKISRHLHNTFFQNCCGFKFRKNKETNKLTNKKVKKQTNKQKQQTN